MTSNQVCPSCGEKAIGSSGILSSPILVIGEFPSVVDIQKGQLFSTHTMYTTSGKVLRTEMANVGLDYNRLCVTTLWVHEPNDNEDCWKTGYDNILDIAKGKRAILLVGSLVVETFTNYKVSDVSSLEVDSAILSCPIIYTMVNPAIVFKPGRGVGEVRLALKRFSERLEKEGLL